MVRSYQCSGCGSAILYNPGTNENICPKCGKKEPISALNANLLNGSFAGKIGPESSDTSGTGAVYYRADGADVLLNNLKSHILNSLDCRISVSASDTFSSSTNRATSI